MKPRRKAGGKTWQLRLYDSTGRAVDRSTGTREARVANAMARTVEKVKERHAYAPLYAALVSGRYTVEEVHEAEGKGELELLVSRLSDVDVEPLVAPWFAALEKKVADDTRKHYLHAVRSLIPAGAPFYLSQLTADTLQGWVDGMEEATGGTVRKRAAGLSRFVDYLVRVKRLADASPMETVELPPPGKPRDHHLDTVEAILLADRHPGVYRLFAAALPGTAMEVSTALAVRARDVSEGDRSIRAPGTKNWNRDRVVRVAEWAWPAVLEAIAGKRPDTRLFEGIPDRWVSRDKHVAACDALLGEGHLIFAGYTMRDHRHTWAVRAVKAGWPIELVARQLGHVDGTLALKVYGRYVPKRAEFDRWEKIAAAMDAANRKEVET